MDRQGGESLDLLLSSAAVRIFLKAAAIVAVAVLGTIAAGPGHAAELESADLMAINRHAWQENVQIGDVFRTFPVAARNKGPYATPTGGPTFEVKLPGNVEFYRESDFGSCEIIVPRKHVKCVVTGMWYPYVEPGGGMGADAVFQWDVVLVSNSTTPGRFTLAYSADPDLSNNSVSFTIDIRNPGAPPAPAPTTKPPAVQPTATASNPPSASPSADTPPSPVHASSPEPSAPSASDTDPAEPGISVSGIIGTAGIIAGAISLAGYLLHVRRRKAGIERQVLDESNDR